MYKFNTFHDEICLELIESVHSKNFSQTYIFEGPQGLNITESAKLFAAAVACQRREAAPCGACAACKLSYAGTNPDIILIDTAGKKSIGVDVVRDMLKDVYVRPFESENKIYIITDGAALTAEAQNAMLKILEEPPEYAVFIIIAASASVLLPTILSRAVKIRFMPLSESEMREYITKNYPDEKNVEFLIRFSEGLPERADNIIKNPDFEPLRQDAFKMILPLLSKHKISAWSVADFLEKNKDNAETILDLWQSFLRDIFLVQSGTPELSANTDMKDELAKLAARLPEKYIIHALNRLIASKNMLRRYVNLHALGLNLSFSIKNAINSL